MSKRKTDHPLALSMLKMGMADIDTPVKRIARESEIVESL